MLFDELKAVNEKYPISKLNKKEAKRVLLEAHFPQWCQRQSDLPTWAMIRISRSLGYRQLDEDKRRESNGWVEVEYDGSYWVCKPLLSEEYAKTEQGQNCLLDFEKMAKDGNIYVNESCYSSERRHAIAVAKAASVTYDLAFSEVDDVESIDPKELMNSKRRTEVYKFVGRMGVPDEKDTPKKTDKKEEKKQEVAQSHPQDTISKAKDEIAAVDENMTTDQETDIREKLQKITQGSAKLDVDEILRAIDGKKTT